MLAGMVLALIVGMKVWDTLGYPFPRCWISETLHVPCPTCGSGRCLLALGRLDLMAAARFNPLLVVAIAGFLLAPFVVASGRFPIGVRGWFTPKRVATISAFLVFTNWIYLFFCSL